MLTIKITPNDKGNPPGKLADATAHDRIRDLILDAYAEYERQTTEAV